MSHLVPRFATALQANRNTLLLAVLLVAVLVCLLRQDAGPPLSQSLHASATHSGPNFVMATGQIDDAVEGVFFLDRITGTLQCWVISKVNGKIAGRFGYANVLKDVGAIEDKNPHLLLTTGLYQMVGGAGLGGRPANCLVYVLNDTTGQFAVYSLPWNTVLHQKPGIVGALTLVNTGMTRDPNQFRDP